MFMVNRHSLTLLTLFSLTSSPLTSPTKPMRKWQLMWPSLTPWRWMATSSASCLSRSSPSPQCSLRMRSTVSTSSSCHLEAQFNHHSRPPLTWIWTSAAQKTTSVQSMPSALIRPSCTSASAPPTTQMSPIRWISKVCTHLFTPIFHFCWFN